MRYELSDYEWTAIKPMLPNKPRGVRRVNDRRVLNGIFWILRSGAPWRDLPETYGPRTTCYNRFVRWRRAGVWDQIMVALAAGHDAAVQMIDTSVHALVVAGSLLLCLEVRDAVIRMCGTTTCRSLFRSCARWEAASMAAASSAIRSRSSRQNLFQPRLPGPDRLSVDVRGTIAAHVSPGSRKRAADLRRCSSGRSEARVGQSSGRARSDQSIK
jgi:transposase